MSSRDLDITLVEAPIAVFVFDAEVWEMNLVIEVRKVVVVRPLRDFSGFAIRAAIRIVAIPIAFVEPPLVVALELVVEDDSIDPRAVLLQAFCFAFEGSIDLDLVFQFALASDARVERLAAVSVAVAMALEQAPSVLRERHGVVARAWHARGLDQALFTEMAKIT